LQVFSSICFFAKRSVFQLCNTILEPYGAQSHTVTSEIIFPCYKSY